MAVDFLTWCDLKRCDYFLIDYSAASSDEEQQEVISFYLSHLRDRENILHLVDTGYRKIPGEVKIISIYDIDEIHCTYKRYWMSAKVEWEKVTMDVQLLWHLHDGASDCADEFWMYVN